MKHYYTVAISKLSPFLHEALVGFLLGDGGIFYAGPRSKTPRFEFSMGQDRFPFASHVASLYQDWASNPLKEVAVQAVKNGKWYVSYRFKSMSSAVFAPYHALFYVYNDTTGKWVKVVPVAILDLLTPVALAYLIMSDGNFDAGRNRVRIYTNSFTKEDTERLAGAIHAKFGIYARVMADKKETDNNKRNAGKKNQWIITIGANELPRLRQLVLPHMVPSMRYRIGV